MNTLRTLYYQYNGKTYLVCVGGANASGKSPIWGCNSCSWLVPGTHEIETGENEETN